MKDIQSQQDHRRISIEKVGVKEISYPITVLDKAHRHQRSVATVNMSVNLPHHFKGTHMSRFVEILNRFHGEINLRSFHLILEEMKEKLEAEQAHMEVEFPYFLQKDSTSTTGLLSKYNCKMHGSYDLEDDLTLEFRVPIAPPGVEQTGEGLPESLGHWGNADICVRFRHFIWIEDLIKVVEEVTSHDLTWSTAQPIPNKHPLSVEQLAKDLGQRLNDHPAISWFSVTVENLSEGFSTFATIHGPQDSSQ